MLPPSPTKPHYPSPQGRPTSLDFATQMLLRCTLTSRKVVCAGVPTRKAIGVPAGGSLGYPLECPLEYPPAGGAGVPAAGPPWGSAH